MGSTASMWSVLMARTKALIGAMLTEMRITRIFDKSFKDDVETALRSSVLHHLVEYKENQSELVSHISGQLLTWEKAVVQHFPTSFKELTHAFLNQVDLKIDQIFLEYDDQHVYTLKDKALLQRWQMFHLLRAPYRVVSVDEAMIEPDL